MVPVTVEREVEGRRSNLQYRPPGTITESQRLESGGGPVDCPLQRYVDAMQIWDTLIANRARGRLNILYDSRNIWQMMLTGHNRTFGGDTRIPSGLPTLGPGWRSILAQLSSDQLRSTLGKTVDDNAIAALLERRDALLSISGD